MADVILDNPGDVHWFAGYGSLPIIGDCQHPCDHRILTNIAWGPDYEHYTLNTCDDVCASRCRGWLAEYPRTAEYADRPRERPHGFREVSREQ